MSEEALSPERKQELAQLIGEHHVAFEITPEAGGVMRTLGKVGVAVKLFAVSSHSAHLAAADCRVCKAVWLRLQALLRAVLPPEAPPRIYQFLPFLSHPGSVNVESRKADVQALAFAFFPEQDAAGSSPLQAPLVTELRSLLRELGAHELTQEAARS